MQELPLDINERLVIISNTLFRENDIALILRAHIILERELNRFNERRLADIKALGRLADGFSNNLRIAQALGLEKEGTTLYRKLNNLRNDVAHKLNYHLTEKSVTELYSCLSLTQKYTLNKLTARLANMNSNRGYSTQLGPKHEYDFTVLILSLWTDLVSHDLDLYKDTDVYGTQKTSK